MAIPSIICSSQITDPKFPKPQPPGPNTHVCSLVLPLSESSVPTSPADYLPVYKASNPLTE